jgi:membrane protein
MKEKLALMIMALIGQHYYQQREAWTLDKLSRQMKVGSEPCGMIINMLEDAGLLIRTADDPPAYLPGHALETLQLQAIVDVVREAGETAYLSPDKLPTADKVDALYQGIETAIDSALEGRTLRDLSLPPSDTESTRIE